MTLLEKHNKKNNIKYYQFDLMDIITKLFYNHVILLLISTLEKIMYSDTKIKCAKACTVKAGKF